MKTLAVLALVLSLASCGFPPPQPRDRWPEPSPELAAHEVLIEGEIKIPTVAGRTFRGNGALTAPYHQDRNDLTGQKQGCHRG